MRRAALPSWCSGWNLKRSDKEEKEQSMGKEKHGKGGKRDTVAVSPADLERAFLTYFAAQGMGLGTECGDMEAAEAVCRSRACECSFVLNRLAAG